MKMLGNLLIILCIFALAGCSTSRVKHGYDKETDFTALKTYNWRPVKRQLNISDLAEEQAKVAVGRHLTAKGLNEAQESPDFTIAMYLGKQLKGNNIDYNPHHGFQRRLYWERWGRTPMDVYEYQEGTMIIDFVNAQTDELMWRGLSKVVLDRVVTPEEMEKRINDTVKEILVNFPPQDS
jgi:hypothetical protein